MMRHNEEHAFAALLDRLQNKIWSVIGGTSIRAMTSSEVRGAANDTMFQSRPISRRLGAKARANPTIFRALLRKLRTQAPRRASSTLTRLSAVFGEAVWSAISITSPHWGTNRIRHPVPRYPSTSSENLSTTLRATPGAALCTAGSSGMSASTRSA